MPRGPSVPPEFERAIALYRDGRVEDARNALLALLATAPQLPQAWNAIGYIERDRGDAAAAAAAFDRALAQDPGDATALRGRARMALERGEIDAPARYERMTAQPGADPAVYIEEAEALLAGGHCDALAKLGARARSDPGWIDGQIALARLSWEWNREPDFDAHLRVLADRAELHPEGWAEWAALLADCGFHARAADTAAQARAITGSAPFWWLAEAIEAGRAGDLDRAEACFAEVPAGMVGRAVHDASHHIRRGELGRANEAIERALREDPRNMAVWGLAELLWRKSGDPRTQWLVQREGLVRTFDLGFAPGEIERIRAVLADLTVRGTLVAGQSVRGGKQTRWRPFDRPDPLLSELRARIEGAIARYRDGLPAADPAHPLLRHRHEPWRIEGNWSVRLTEGGRHVSHIHPLGIVSSASYWALPDRSDEPGGRLELGRPPADLALELAPLAVIEPKLGELTLFPSFLFHGTTTFRAGERISLAFDVVRAQIG